MRLQDGDVIGIPGSVRFVFLSTTCVVPSWKACLSLCTTGPRSLTQRRSLDNGVLAGGARLPGDVRSGLNRITRRSPRRKTLPEIVNFHEPPRNRLAHGKAGA